MRLVFICGSLEPGCDGVGDYSRRISCELIRQGHSATIIALNDLASVETAKQTQQADGISVAVLRIPNAAKDSIRYKQAKEFIEQFRPDWISVQFVPFSYHPKGMPFGMAKNLARLGDHVKWHIMFHELWVNGSGFKDKAVAFFQKIPIRRIISALSPALITTTIPLYKKNLANNNAVLLPIFSNISIAKIAIEETPEIKNTLTAIFFGSFSSAAAEFRQQVEWVKGLADFQNKTCKLVLLGNGGPFAQDALHTASAVLGQEHVLSKGILPENEISELLQRADIGVSRADDIFWGKSGSALAMLEHGLPLLLRGDEKGERHVLPAYQQGYKQRIFFTDLKYPKVPVKVNPQGSLQAIASSFITLLNENFRS